MNISKITFIYIKTLTEYLMRIFDRIKNHQFRYLVEFLCQKVPLSFNLQMPVIIIEQVKSKKKKFN